MSNSNSTAKQLLEDPSMYMVEFIGDNALFAHMTRETYHNSIFKDRYRIQTAKPEPQITAIKQLTDALSNGNTIQANIDFIIHPANCGSTLLSRAIDFPGRNIIYREPFTLRQLGVEHSQSVATDALENIWKRKLILALRMLGKTYSTHESPIIKTNIPINFILKDVLKILSNSRGIILYSDLKSFLISALKSKERRQWVKQVITEMANAIRHIPALSKIEVDGLSIARTAALIWVAQYLLYIDITSTHATFKTLKSNIFYDDPHSSLTASFEHFNNEVSKSEIDGIVGSELFQRYSKNPTISYNEAVRKSDEKLLEEKLHDELQDAYHWGNTILENNHINPSLPNPLLS